MFTLVPKCMYRKCPSGTKTDSLSTPSELNNVFVFMALILILSHDIEERGK